MLKKRKARAKKKRQVTCSVCNTVGHNARGCPSKNQPIIETKAETSFSKAKAKQKELGHKILAEKKKKVEREEIDGLAPQKGLWIVHHLRKKIAGKISKVKRNGEVVWKSALGAIISTDQQKLIKEGYSYIKDLEPEMLRWKII